MKTLVKFCALMLMFQAGTLMMPQKASAQYAEVNYQVFYDQLSPYGMWVADPNYGYVWIPDVGPGFRPYATGGYWVMTDFGWTWVSDYRWGWGPFHYGRWYFEPVYGWIWVPGNEWGPAWVTWRRCNGYYGWIPLGPGITINMTFGPQYAVPDEHWIFVRDVDFGRHNIEHYYVRRTENASILRRSAVIKNTRTDNVRHQTYITGPDRNEVQRVTKRTVQVLPTRETTQPGQSVSKGRVEIYRPVVQATPKNGARPVPGKVVNLKEVKPVSERVNEKPQGNTQPQTRENKQENKNPMVQPGGQRSTPQPVHKQQTQTQQRTNPRETQGTRPAQQNKIAQPAKQHTSTQPARQHNTVQPVQKKTQQPADKAKPVSKPKEDRKGNEPRK